MGHSEPQLPAGMQLCSIASSLGTALGCPLPWRRTCCTWTHGSEPEQLGRGTLASEQKGAEILAEGCGDSKVQVDIGYGWSMGWACLRCKEHRRDFPHLMVRSCLSHRSLAEKRHHD